MGQLWAELRFYGSQVVIINIYIYIKYIFVVIVIFCNQDTLSTCVDARQSRQSFLRQYCVPINFVLIS